MIREQHNCIRRDRAAAAGYAYDCLFSGGQEPEALRALYSCKKKHTAVDIGASRSVLGLGLEEVAP